MNGTGVPLATPFDETGALLTDRLQELVGWLADRGVDFFVPCGSTSEAPFLTAEERGRVIEAVARATTQPVLAGTGRPGYRATLSATERAAEAGADAALVVTPHYYHHDDETLAAYYRDLAGESPIPIYAYSVPKFTGVSLDPRTVERLATHDNVHGLKDSSGDLEALQRHCRLTDDEEFSVLCGSGSVYAAALDAGVDGGVLAVANVVPDLASEVYRCSIAGSPERARELNAALIDLNRAVTVRHGIPGLKAAMRHRDAPAGYVRRPFRRVDDDVAGELAALVEGTLG